MEKPQPLPPQSLTATDKQQQQQPPALAPASVPVASAMLMGRETVRTGGPCPLSRHTVYLIRVRARGRQWVVRRRYRQFHALHREIEDADLRAVFPPRSLCAQGGLACALETRQVRLAYYVNELVNTKLPSLPAAAQGAVLRFLEGGFAGAAGEGEEEEDDKEEDGVRKSLTALADEEKNVGLATGGGMIEVDGRSRKARLSPKGASQRLVEEEELRQRQQEQQAPWAVLDAEGRAAYERLRATLGNGITVVKHGRRGAPKRRLIFCNEDATTLYWAGSSSSSSSSSRRRRQQQQQDGGGGGGGLSSLSLADVSEVRAGTAPDPDHPGQLGTATLRRRRSAALAMVPALAAGQEEARRRRAERGLSLITAARSLDLEALTPGDHRLLLDGFRAAVCVARGRREREAAAAAAAAVGLRSPRSGAGGVLGKVGETAERRAPPPAFGP